MRALHLISAPLRGLRLLALAAALALPLAAVAEEEVAVIVHPSNPAASISRREATRYFLRQATDWPNGQRARPVDQAQGSGVRAAFTVKVLGRSVADMDTFWSQAFYSGRAVPPPVKSDDAAVVEYVRANPGAIGYVSATTATEGVKRLPIRD